jgi:hypothetical protein
MDAGLERRTTTEAINVAISNSDVPDMAQFSCPLVRQIVFCLKTNAPVNNRLCEKDVPKRLQKKFMGLFVLSSLSAVRLNANPLLALA